jgi:two-component system sensor histidine kinase YesM
VARRRLLMVTKLINKVRTFYNNLRIRDKILIVLTFVIILFFTVTLITTKLTFSIYSAVQYEQTYNTLNLTTTNIEHDLQNIDTVSYDIVCDSNVQQYVDTIKYSPDFYGVSNSLTSLLGQLTTYSMNQRYISSINFINTNYSQSTTGLMDSQIAEQYADEIARDAAAANGSSIFLGPMGNDSSFYLAREIRAVPDLRLNNMGTIVIRCNVAKIVSNYLNVTKVNSSTLAIFNGKNLIFNSSKISVNDSEIAGNSQNASYVIKKIDGQKYFLAINQSNYTGWKYVYMIPYDTIFHKIIDIQIVEIIIFFVAFFVVILLGVWFAVGLTKPLEKLTDEIKLVETGNFNLPFERIEREQRLDEIGVLGNDFELMIKKIDELISENYVKQLMIKDTQMKALQAQINPHFMYNTLESINWMAKVNSQTDISRMAESLGNLLRGALKSKEKTIQIDEELKLLQNYITIQKIRYEDRLNFQLLIEDSLRIYKIPQMTLQPIVENSIAYGLESMSGTCTIRVSFISADDCIRIMIEDNGLGIEPELLQQINSGNFKPRGFGIGLKNINERLKLVFGDEYGIIVYSQPGEGTKVIIHIPRQE